MFGLSGLKKSLCERLRKHCKYFRRVHISFIPVYSFCVTNLFSQVWINAVAWCQSVFKWLVNIAWMSLGKIALSEFTAPLIRPNLEKY